MASFGGFDSEREVYSDPIYAVYNARKRGDPKGEYAVKVFRFSGSDLEAELAHEAGGRDELVLARWSSIMVQEKAGAASKFVAPIFEKGNDERGIWYATRFYPRSVNKMMSGKVALPPASLHHILYSIAQGAYDLKRECGRSHGDIQPTKVQVSKSEKLTEAEVVLSDPLAGGEEEAAQYEVNDLHAIGLILLQLVRQRLLSHDDVVLMLPIVASAEWTRVFGARADQWLALCNRLLDPNLSPKQFTLEALLRRLEELKPKRRSSAKLVAVTIAALVVLGAAGIWTWWWPRGGTVEITSDPDGATILVDNASNSSGTTPISLTLSKGNHVIVGRHDQLGLGALTNKCLVESGASTREHLKFTYGTVVIKCDPPGATILRDGATLGQMGMDGQPFTNRVAPGPVKYQLTLDQYERAEVTGVVSNLQTLELAVTLRSNEVVSVVPVVVETNDTTAITSPAGDGVIELRAEPVAALIFNPDGLPVGSASVDKPLKLTNAPGKYPFAARTQGYEEVLATLTFEPGVASKYTFVFPHGKVEWKTEPVAATVTAGSNAMTSPAVFIQKPGVVTRYVITAPGYQSVTNDLTLKKGDRKIILTNLFPLLVSVQLVSDPDGAEFFGLNGAAFPRTDKATYMLPLGATNLVARFAGLVNITNPLELTPDRPRSPVSFKFDYGKLYLTNLPSDITVYEGAVKVGSASDQWVYQRRGVHLYALKSRAGAALNVETNISAGFNAFRSYVAGKSWKNALEMQFAWVPNLPGGGGWLGQTEPGGWVGVSEVTQAQYKKMDGSDPSAYQKGGDNYPVENVTWDQAMKYCKWLSDKDTSEHSGWRYTLPTEEQFTFFAADADLLPKVSSEIRVAVQDTRFNPQQLGAKIPAIEKLSNNSGTRLHPEPVGSTKERNRYDLYDVVGNVSEWLEHSSDNLNWYGGGSYDKVIPKNGGTTIREHGLDKGGPNIGFRVILVPSR